MNALLFHRYVALGDSFTEGVGDPDPSRPNGLRGWADRVAEALADRAQRADSEFGYANLAIRGRKLGAILDEQVDPALALQPDLVTVYAGANDLLRPKVDIDALARRYDEAVGTLTASGAVVGLFTAFDPGSQGLFARLRGRFALYNEQVREIADKHGAVVLDSWRMRPDRPETMWAEDRLHLGPAGHQVVAIAVLEALGVPHDLALLEAPAPVQRTAREVRATNLAWARTHAAPWVHRRLTGRSSGDGIAPKRPALAPIGPC
ncbi:SGNH/GDSL hydrolase family protein [Nocardioides terrisoli]|uniref:SGNH/GDSL hydrolase family protein n=1 Tax=Nocardioides terrisoli TaxID=3388267 RepID=UPI00287B9176|nr:SGNH/GDSL hydrolase family protein [Nocardioides marmorisolisilvae]